MARVILAVAALALWQVEAKAATCAGTSTKFCITHDGSKFKLDDGTTNSNRAIILIAGTTYTFVAATDFTYHPFSIMTDVNGGTASTNLGSGDGISGTMGINTGGQSFTYTPPAARTGVYYNCEFHPNLGNSITVVTAGSDLAQPASTDMATSPTPADLAYQPNDDIGSAPAPDMAAASTSKSCSFAMSASSSFGGALLLLPLIILGLGRRRRRVA